jgi:anti-sigma regulatory factor (Ser/Thr protein kinase)
VRDALVGSGPDLVEAATLLTSELATNAVVHGRSSVEVRIERWDRSVCIAVVDESNDMPAIMEADASATRWSWAGAHPRSLGRLGNHGGGLRQSSLVLPP